MKILPKLSTLLSLLAVGPFVLAAGGQNSGQSLAYTSDESIREVANAEKPGNLKVVYTDPQEALEAIYEKGQGNAVMPLPQSAYTPYAPPKKVSTNVYFAQAYNPYVIRQVHVRSRAPVAAPTSGNCRHVEVIDKVHTIAGKLGYDPVGMIANQVTTELGSWGFSIIGNAVVGIIYSALYTNCGRDEEITHSQAYQAGLRSLPYGLGKPLAAKVPFVSGCTNPEAVKYPEGPTSVKSAGERAEEYFDRYCPEKKPPRHVLYPPTGTPTF